MALLWWTGQCRVGALSACVVRLDVQAAEVTTIERKESGLGLDDVDVFGLGMVDGLSDEGDRHLIAAHYFVAPDLSFGRPKLRLAHGDTSARLSAILIPPS